MTVTVSGDKELNRKLNKLGLKMGQAIDAGVFITAQDVRTDAIKSIQNQSTGRAVSRSRQGGGTYTHVASNEGQAPNTDTGKLVASIAIEKEADANYLVGSNLDYAAFLEFGTSKTGARPWLEPAMRKNISELNKNISKAADITIKKASK
jgi:HK97 gp10 family phage protein